MAETTDPVMLGEPFNSAFNPNPPDYIGLLCLQTAKAGGESQLVSGLALHDELLTGYPEALRTLYHSFCFDRRGQFTTGEPPVLENPVFLGMVSDAASISALLHRGRT